MEQSKSHLSRRGLLKGLAGTAVTAVAVTKPFSNSAHASNPQACGVGFTLEEQAFTVLPGGANCRQCPRTTAVRLDFLAGNTEFVSTGYTTAGEPVWDDVLRKMNPYWYRSADDGGGWVSATRLPRFTHLIERGIRHALEAVK